MKKTVLVIFISFLYSFVYGRQQAGAIVKMVFPEMVKVHGGTFNMGSNSGDIYEKPVHTVTVSSFRMGKYEVTVAEFAAFVDAAGYVTDAEKKGSSWVFTGAFTKENGVTWRDDEEGHRRKEAEWNMPVIHVSWNDAIAYCKWLSSATGKAYRLPTEAEWEYAAGNGAKHTRYSWGNSLPGGGKPVGNLADETTHPQLGGLKEKFIGYNDGYFFSAPVGSYAPNSFGLYDMIGNVWEWCNDWLDTNYYTKSQAVDPQGAATGLFRIIRGGSWFGGPDFTSVTYRAGMTPEYHALNIGFRVVSSL